MAPNLYMVLLLFFLTLRKELLSFTSMNIMFIGVYLTGYTFYSFKIVEKFRFRLNGSDKNWYSYGRCARDFVFK